MEQVPSSGPLAILTGAIGDGSFTWPADNNTLSGYDYTAIHHGLDIRATQGAPIYAVDSGVVVYAGWNDFGYGNLVLIDHGNGGYLCEVDSVEQMVTAIRNLAQSVELRRKMGAHNRQVVLKRFTLEQMSSRYLSLYQSLLS